MLGRPATRGAAAKIPFTASFAFGAVACAAGIATLDAYGETDALARMERSGRRLVDGLARAAAAAGHRVELSCPPTMPTLRFEGEDKAAVHAIVDRFRTALRAVDPALDFTIDL